MSWEENPKLCNAEVMEDEYSWSTEINTADRSFTADPMISDVKASE